MVGFRLLAEDSEAPIQRLRLRLESPELTKMVNRRESQGFSRRSQGFTRLV